MTSLRIKTDDFPIELTTSEGYNDFVTSPLNREHSTVFPDNGQTGYVLVNDQIVATVSGEARDHLFSYTHDYDSHNDQLLSSPVRH